MTVSNPNQRCTCGFTRFRETRSRITEDVERWMLFDGAVPSGLGATPFGTFFGGGSAATWGLFPGVFNAASLVVTCESCNRVRAQKQLGGITPLGVYRENNSVIIAVADVSRPVTCFSLRLTGPDGAVLEVPLSYLPGAPPPIFAPTPVTVASVPPPGAGIVDTLLIASIPELTTSGDYLLTLIDRCCGCETPLVTITLEAPPMILSPLDADIGGAPRRWLTNQRVTADVAQPAGSTRPTIPFDKCTAVLEYDARSGVLPSGEGWTRVGTGPVGNWALVEGGALRLGTTSPNTNYWEKTLLPVVGLTQVYGYATVLSEDIPAGAAASGLDVQGIYRTGVAPYNGVRMAMRENQFYYPRLDGVSAVQLHSSEAAPAWLSVSAAQKVGGSVVLGESTTLPDASEVFPANTFDTIGVAGANELKVRFGNTVGAPTLVGYFREVVVSGPGRFVRARFSAYTQVIAPLVRLYLVSDTTGSASRKARFLIKYGPGTGNPYGPLPMSAGATVNMLTPNAIYEVAFALPGLTANQPFWFTVERDWSHGDDLLEATVHMHQATVRAA